MADQKKNQTNQTAEEKQLQALKLRFSSSLAPAPARSISRKAWGIDVNTVFVPYFTAMKTIGAEGVQDLPDAALGAPIVLARDKTGNVRVSKAGRLSYKVNPDLGLLIKRQQQNYIARLQQETGVIISEAPKAFAAQVVAQQAAGQPIIDQDGYDMMVFEEALAEAQAKAEAEAETPAPEEERMPVAAD